MKKSAPNREKKSAPKIHHFFTVSFSPFTSSWSSWQRVDLMVVPAWQGCLPQSLCEVGRDDELNMVCAEGGGEHQRTQKLWPWRSCQCLLKTKTCDPDCLVNPQIPGFPYIDKLSLTLGDWFLYATSAGRCCPFWQFSSSGVQSLVPKGL